MDIAVVRTLDGDAPLVQTLASLATLSRALRMHWLADLGIEVGQDMLLNRLSASEAVCVSDLAYRLQIRPSTVSKMLDRLAEKGWCERVDTPHDKRRTLVRLTSAGEQKRRKVDEVFAKGESELLKALRHDSSNTMVPHLEEARKALQRCVDRVR